MNWLSGLNDAIRYIEENLDGEIDLTQAARLASCSAFHFQRMFSYLAGVPLAEYIRRRRMTCAAFELQNTDSRVIDIALRYGYDSPTAFNRAFQSVHGVAPSLAREQGVRLKAYQPVSFKITIRGEAEMNYRIEKRNAFRLVGYKTASTWTPEKQEGFALIPKFWQEKGPAIPALMPLMEGQPLGLLGVSVGDWQTAGRFDYYIAVASQKPAAAGMEAYEVPACTWAVFECKGAIPASIQTMQKRIMTEWLPSSGYRYADAPDIEQYTEGDQSSEDYLCYIWVPVEK